MTLGCKMRVGVPQPYGSSNQQPKKLRAHSIQKQAYTGLEIGSPDEDNAALCIGEPADETDNTPMVGLPDEEEESGRDLCRNEVEASSGQLQRGNNQHKNKKKKQGRDLLLPLSISTESVLGIEDRGIGHGRRGYSAEVYDDNHGYKWNRQNNRNERQPLIEKYLDWKTFVFVMALLIGKVQSARLPRDYRYRCYNFDSDTRFESSELDIMKNGEKICSHVPKSLDKLFSCTAPLTYAFLTNGKTVKYCTKSHTENLTLMAMIGGEKMSIRPYKEPESVDEDRIRTLINIHSEKVTKPPMGSPIPTTVNISPTPNATTKNYDLIVGLSITTAVVLMISVELYYWCIGRNTSHDPGNIGGEEQSRVL
ncbi:uncharacterized protein [Hyperolius riggenbachi]|uniref:uncharacterized protein n=1 Tax=Hyperolius riggenbachi TaxID=752182 RepID=UPI0035A308CB